MGVYREAIGGKSGNQDGEGRGQAKTRHAYTDIRDYAEGRGQKQAGDMVTVTTSPRPSSFSASGRLCLPISHRGFGCSLSAVWNGLMV